MKRNLVFKMNLEKKGLLSNLTIKDVECLKEFVAISQSKFDAKPHSWTYSELFLYEQVAKHNYILDEKNKIANFLNLPKMCTNDLIKYIYESEEK